MARHFLRLRLRVFVNGLTRGTGSQQLLGILGLALAVLVGLGVAVGFVAARGSTGVDNAALIFVGLFAVGWLILPVLLFGSDNTVDPMRFSLLPLSPQQLVRGQVVAGLVGGPTIFAVLTLGAVAYALADSAATGAIAVVAVVLTLLMCQVGSRAFTTSIGGALRSRRGRDFALLAAALLAASIYPIQLTLQSYLTETGAAGVGRIADLVAWLPFGWPFAAVLEARAGEWQLVAVRLGASAAVIAVLGWVWGRAVTRTLEGPEAAGPASRAVSGDLAPGWARPLLPRGALGAVAAKELRYWWRDPRRRAAALTALFVGVGVVAATTLNDSGLGRQLAFSGVAVAFFATMNCANQFGLDGTAIWSTIAAPDSAAADVRGRQLAVALLAGPACVFITVGGTILGGAPISWGAAALGLCAAALGAGLAATTVLAVSAPYSVPENPTNPFATGGAGGCSTAAYQLVGFLAQLLIVAPVVALVIWGVVGDRPSLQWAVLAVGPLWGFVAATSGARIAIRMLERRGPDVLLAVTPRG